MQLNHIPKIGTRYWTALIVASIFGANTGDFFAEVLHLGHIGGLPILAVVLAVIMTIERRSSGGHQFYFWAAIVVIRTAATNMGDIGHDLRWNPLIVMAGWAVTLVAVVVCWNAYDLKKSHGSHTQNSMLFATVPIYWVAMFLAGTLGTVAGDYFSYALKLGNLNAALLLGLGVAIAFVVGLRGLQTTWYYYWLTIVLIRSAGTAAGDFAAHGLRLPLATALTGTVFVLLLSQWREKVDSAVVQPGESPSGA